MPIQERLTAGRAALLVVDVQERLLPSILDPGPLLAQVVRLVKAARLLEIPVFATEQYPRGLGPTVPALADLIPDRPSKMTFHCCGAAGLVDDLRGRGVRHVTLAGIEAHVCVAQTALELLGSGFIVQVPADAVGSRSRFDWEFAMRRLESACAVVSTSEAVLFEWLEDASHPQFRSISALIKDFARPTQPEKTP